MHPYLNELRRETVEMYMLNKSRKNPINKLIYKYRKKMDYFTRRAVDKFLELNDELREVYHFQQRLYRVYKTKGYDRAKKALLSLTDDMAHSK